MLNKERINGTSIEQCLCFFREYRPCKILPPSLNQPVKCRSNQTSFQHRLRHHRLF